MKWKRKRKWALSLVVSFAMLFSNVGTAAAVGPIDPEAQPTDTIWRCGLDGIGVTWLE